MEINIYKFIYPIIYIAIAIIIYEVIRIIIEKAMSKTILKKRHHQKRIKTINSLLINIIRYLMIIIVVIAILADFGINVKSIIAGLGITAAIIGLAFQDIAKDFLAGISIIIEDQYEIGDTVEINGFMGEIVALSLKTTRIRNYKGQTLIIANHTITNIINYNLSNSVAVVDVSVRYDQDLDKVEKVLNEMANRLQGKIPNAKGKIKILGINELESSGIIYRLTVETVSAQHYSVERYLRKEIKDTFDKEKIEIPYQQIEVHNGK